MAYLVALTLDRGRTAGLLAIAGIAAGLAVHAVIAAIGLGALIGSVPLIYDLLRWIGVAYILFLAWETWQSSDLNDGRQVVGAGSNSWFWRGFVSNVFNPKSILFFVSVVPGFVRHNPDASPLFVQLAQFGMTYVAIATTVHVSIAVLASQSRSWLMAESRQELIRRILAIALVFVAAWLAWKTQR